MPELHTPQEAAHWLRQRVCGSLRSDSRKLAPGDGFLAWPGERGDGRAHLAAAWAQGATACLMEGRGLDHETVSDERIGFFNALKAASGAIAAEFLGQPSQQLALLAVTGTNGKTSTVWWLAQALSRLRQVAPMSCAMIGTLGAGLPDQPLATGLTTPDAVELQQLLRRFADSAVQVCALEASSIGLAEQRLLGCRIQTAIFTNFTQDHLDYHGTMQSYWQAKRQLFDWPGLAAAVINIDDPQGAALALELDGRTLDLWTVSCTADARLQACDIRHQTRGLSFTLFERARSGAAPAPGQRMQTNLVGAYNVSNLLGVMAAMRSLDIPLAAVVEACSNLPSVPGRMEYLEHPDQALVVVDYAHTPDALEKVLLALQPVARSRGGQLWCIFGCGGERDASKRPLMGVIAARHADCVVLTSDNPRSEEPQAIISQILLGMAGRESVSVQSDRAQAIANTLAMAGRNDVVLIAGKGHEAYQEIAGQRLAFSDQEQVRQARCAASLQASLELPHG